MKASIVVAVAVLFATGSALAQNVQPQQAKKATIRVAQAPAGGMAAGAGEAAGVAGTTLSGGAFVAIGAGVSLVGAASGGNNSTTNH
jgi:hypothetical protein